MQLPTQKQCFDLWDKYQMPENIKRHSKTVTLAADAIALYIESQGVKLDKDLVNRGALLHDIAKIVAVNANTENRHAIMGAEIVEKENITSDIAEIVRQHFITNFNEKRTIEQLIVNYADKRVIHDKIVSLAERFDYIHKTYPRSKSIVMESEKNYFEFERKYRIDQLDLMEK